MKSMLRRTCASTLMAVIIAGGRAVATTIPFTEPFTSDAANWRNASGAANATWLATGGADTGGYISQEYNFVSSVVGGPPVVLLRGQSNFGSSGNNFFGNWIADGVTEFRIWVRHNAPTNVTFFARFASPAAFPGAFAELTPIPPGAWTRLTVPITADNPQFITFEGSDFATVFSNVGRVQIGVDIPDSLAGVDAAYSFDADLVSIVGILGDTDGNGCVNRSDLTRLLAHFVNSAG